MVPNITKGTKIASQTYLVKSAAAFMTAIANETYLNMQMKRIKVSPAMTQLV
jgi:hypothetical protein